MFDSIKTAPVPGKAIAAFDAEVLRTLRLKDSTGKAVSAERMTIGIRNEAGDIYRCIGITGLTLLLNTIDKLAGLGFVDELKDATDSKQGCDAIFSRNDLPPVLVRSAGGVRG